MLRAFCSSPLFFLCVISSNTFSALLSFFQTPFQAFICYQSPNSHFYFHFLKKQSTSKHYNFFYLLYHINNFLTIQIKKFTTMQFFFFHFAIQILSTLYHINHFLLLFKKKKSTQQYLPKIPKVLEDVKTLLIFLFLF